MDHSSLRLIALISVRFQRNGCTTVKSHAKIAGKVLASKMHLPFLVKSQYLKYPDIVIKSLAVQATTTRRRIFATEVCERAVAALSRTFDDIVIVAVEFVMSLTATIH